MTKYHCVLGKNKVTSEDVEDCLCSSFTNRDKGRKHRDITSGKYVIVDCGSDEDFEVSHAELADLIPDNYPAWMTSLVPNPLNMTHAEARLLGRDSKFINRAAL
jgi:hypothetical protein